MMIKNLLFDLGGVILNIDRTKAVEALKAIGMRDPEDLLGDYGQKGHSSISNLAKLHPSSFMPSCSLILRLRYRAKLLMKLSVSSCVVFRSKDFMNLRI